MAKPRFNESVFINCPFDTQYGAMLDAIVFAVHDCGYVARCAKELRDTGRARIDKLLDLIGSCRFGIHDISRTELDPINSLPRFNMPLELGLFLGARKFGRGRDQTKVCLVLDTEPYRYQKFCSDIAGQDPEPHKGEPLQAIRIVRDWLRAYSNFAMPGGAMMGKRYEAFRAALPTMCDDAQLEIGQVTFIDYTSLVVEWLRTNPGSGATADGRASRPAA